MDNLIIEHIDQAKWLKSINYYPKKIGQLRHFIYMLDKLNLFGGMQDKEYRAISSMGGDRLDAIYAVLRIGQKTFDEFLEIIIKFFLDYVKKIFKPSSDPNYDIFLEQLVQDFDYLIANIIREYYPHLDEEVLRQKMIEHFALAFQKKFYTKAMKGLKYRKNAFVHDDIRLAVLVRQILQLDRKHLYPIYQSLVQIVCQIFEDTNIEEIQWQLSHMGVHKFLTETCTELEIFSEERLNAEISNIVRENHESNIWSSPSSSSLSKRLFI
jgi:hypothetical protein